MRVRITSVLQLYTDGKKIIEVPGETILEVINQLDRLYPGIKFRFIDEQEQIRANMNLFLNKQHITDLNRPVGDSDELFIVESLSGG